MKLALLVCLTACIDVRRVVIDSGIPQSVPAIVQTRPAAGAEKVATLVEMSIFFSQPMDQASVTISSAPAAGLRIVGWDDSSTILTVLPESPLRISTLYSFTVRGAAATGVPLESGTFSFTTDATPGVALSVPSSGATNVAANTTLSITFTHPVTAATVSVLLSPEVPLGEPSWNDTFTTVTYPALSLQEGRSYQVTVQGETQGDGALVNNLVWQFTTVADTKPPVIMAKAPSGAGVHQNLNLVSVSFSEPMDTTTGAVAISGPSAPLCNLQWAGSTQLLCLLPAGLLTFNATYDVTVTAQDAAHNALASPRTFSFQVTETQDVSHPVVLQWGLTAFVKELNAAYKANVPWANPFPVGQNFFPRAVAPSTTIIIVMSEPVNLTQSNFKVLKHTRLNGADVPLTTQIPVTIDASRAPTYYIDVSDDAWGQGSRIDWVIDPSLTDFVGLSVQASPALTASFRMAETVTNKNFDASSSYDGYIDKLNSTYTPHAPLNDKIYAGRRNFLGEYGYSRAFTSFDLASIGQGVLSIAKATLQLHVSSCPGDPIADVGAFKAELVVPQFGTTLVDQDYSSPASESATFSGTDSDLTGVIGFDVTSDIFRFLQSEGTRTGFRLRFDGGIVAVSNTSDYCEFWAGASALAPDLVVTWTGPGDNLAVP